jgi:NAD(P)-dependent dehydrogenase (short-subunit alcohol dehydrogenase family)
VTATRERWSVDVLPDQAGRTVLVTGVTSGLGFHNARELARRNARVILAGRSPEKLTATRERIAAEARDADLHPLVVDLADLSSVRRAAGEARGLGPVDVLVNNAGVMATPERRTADGLELQMATNHFGPFLLTGLLLPQLLESGDARVVTVSSPMHRVARRAPLDDPRRHHVRYHRWQVYSQTKLANLLFTYELERRARARGLPLKALAAHPGYAATHLIATGQTGRGRGGMADIFNGFARATAQPAEIGALPTLMAATADLPGGTYVGPGGIAELRGLPKVVGSTRLSRDERAQRRLWEISEQTVGLAYP